MNDYISRESAIERLEKLFQLQVPTARAIIEAIPAADVKTAVHGAWHGSGDSYADGHLVIDEWECPCCGKYFPEWDEKPDWNYCPNCGADMREDVAP